jgi:hypothetical protein
MKKKKIKEETGKTTAVLLYRREHDHIHQYSYTCLTGRCCGGHDQKDDDRQ